jgi:hypothetical protein
MSTEPRTWLRVAGGWLLLVGFAHLGSHTWTYVLENGMVGMQEFAMNAMKQAQSFDPLRPSLWRQFRVFSVSFALLLLFAGAVNLLIASRGTAQETIRSYALFATVFWTGAFIPFAFVDPVIQPIVVAVVAVPLHGIAYLTASKSP